MLVENAICPVHPEGETHSTSEISPKRWPLATPGGRVFAEWQDDLPVTREGQLIFFFQFLHEGRRWSELLADTPLGYQGNQRELRGRLIIKRAQPTFKQSIH